MSAKRSAPIISIRDRGCAPLAAALSHRNCYLVPPPLRRAPLTSSLRVFPKEIKGLLPATIVRPFAPPSSNDPHLRKCSTTLHWRTPVTCHPSRLTVRRPLPLMHQSLDRKRAPSGALVLKLIPTQWSPEASPRCHKPLATPPATH